MPPPTTAQIATNITVQLEASLSQDIPLLPKAFSRVLAKVLAGVYVTLYKYAGYSLLQQFVDKASMAETVVNGKPLRPLVEWGRLIGVGDPKGAVQAELELSVVVLTQTGSLPGGTQLLHAPTGVVYQTVAAVPLDAPGVIVTARATSDQAGGDGSGAVGNLEPGAVLQFASKPAAVAQNPVVTATAVEGAEAELESVYRDRIKLRFRRRPQGGAYADYLQWGTSVEGVAAIFPYTGFPGEVDVYVESVVDLDGIPSGALIDSVRDAINFDPDEFPTPTGLANRRPANAAINVLPITRSAFDVEVAGLEGGDAATVLAAMEAGVDEFLRSREPFIVGLSSLPRLDRVTQGAVAGVVNEIAEANGAAVSAVVLRRGVVVVTQYNLAHGERAKLGAVIPI